MDVFKSGFGIQGGVDGKSNLINMITGLWIIQQCREKWNREKGKPVSWDEIVRAAQEAPPGKAFIDVQDPDFMLANPDMPGVVCDYCRKTGQYVPQNMGGVARVVYESMVLKFKDCLKKMENITRRRVELFHIFGGGVQNKLLCQWMADALGKPIKAGPVETTSVGNLLMQMKAMGDINDVNEGRKISAASFKTGEYQPADMTEWDGYFARYKKMFG